MLSGEFEDGASVSGGTKSFSMGTSMWVSSETEGFWRREVGPVGREGRVGVEEKWEIGLVLGVERREKVM